MQLDNIETLVDKAHQIFNQTSLHEVIDMGRGSATDTLRDFYENADTGDIERYLDIVEMLKAETSP